MMAKGIFLLISRQSPAKRPIFLPIFFVFFLSFFPHSDFAQTCVYNDLSYRFRITVQVARRAEDSIMAYDCPVKVTIASKATPHTIQVINFAATALTYETFTKCGFARSYSTGKNKHALVTDTDFGDIVVGDFNFDSLEDIAIKCDVGNFGCYYRFYTQGKDHRFHLDAYLSDSIRLVPTYINVAKKIIKCYRHAGVRDGEMTYRMDAHKKTWSLIHHRFIPPL